VAAAALAAIPAAQMISGVENHQPSVKIKIIRPDFLRSRLILIFFLMKLG
jgi:hypothetical protein